MKLTLKIKLLPDCQQADLLLKTIKEANKACNALSTIGWEGKCFQQFKLHQKSYYTIKPCFNLSSQIIIRCISKVTDSYRIDRNIQLSEPLENWVLFPMIERILSYNPNDTVSIWAIGGRLKIPFVCYNRNYLPYMKGEADLVFKKGKFFLCQTVDTQEENLEDVEQFIGVDMGLIEIATLSDGESFNSNELTVYREKRQKVRSSLQSKGTKNAKRVLKRLSGKERTHGTIVNHTISKKIVQMC